MEEIATKMVEIANRIGKLETNIVTERTARMDAEQHVHTLTAQLQSFDQKPDNPSASSVGKDDRHERCRESMASWTHLRRVGGTAGSRSCVLRQTAGQDSEERHEELSGVRNSCHGLDVGLEQNSGFGHRWQCWRR